MAKYRIKNEAVEKAVRGLFKTQEAFEKQLNAWSEYHFKYYSNYSCIKIVANSAESITGYACELYVATSDVEEIIEYDPRKWNPYPQVTPPKDDYYRVQMTLPNFEVKRFMLEWLDGKWRVNHLYEHRELLFKPWDDEEDN